MTDHHQYTRRWVTVIDACIDPLSHIYLSLFNPHPFTSPSSRIVKLFTSCKTCQLGRTKRNGGTRDKWVHYLSEGWEKVCGQDGRYTQPPSPCHMHVPYKPYPPLRGNLEDDNNPIASWPTADGNATDGPRWTYNSREMGVMTFDTMAAPPAVGSPTLWILLLQRRG